MGKYEAEGLSLLDNFTGTDPFIGTENEISEEEELKVEVTVTGARLEETLAAVKAIHPYEEPVINVIELYSTGL